MTKQEIIDTINNFHETKQDAEDWWKVYNSAFGQVPKDMLKIRYELKRLENMIIEIQTGTFL